MRKHGLWFSAQITMKTTFLYTISSFPSFLSSPSPRRLYHFIRERPKTLINYLCHCHLHIKRPGWFGLYLRRVWPKFSVRSRSSTLSLSLITTTIVPNAGKMRNRDSWWIHPSSIVSRVFNMNITVNNNHLNNGFYSQFTQQTTFLFRDDIVRLWHSQFSIYLYFV